MSEPSSAAPGHPAAVATTRSHPAVVAAMVFAWLLLAAGAFIVIAYVLGWLPKGAPGLPPILGDEAKPAAAPRTQSGVVLLPGETLVEPPAKPAPATAPPGIDTPAAPAAPMKPNYARPAAKPAPTRQAQAQAPSKPPQPPRASALGPQPGPQSSREEMRAREERSVCLNCATITSIQPRGDGWEVAVRFDDGSREVIRYYDPPRLRVGDAVHLEDGRLIRD